MTCSGLLAGDVVASWAYTEPVPNDRLGTVTLEARIDGGEVVLNGVKRPVESADQASHLLVTGRTGDGLTQVLVPADCRRRHASRRCRRVDLTRRFATVTFDDVRVAADRGRRRGRAATTGRRRQLQLALVMLDRRDRSARCSGVRHDGRVGVRPLLVRPAAGVVPGAQAPLRRHEVVARGEPRDQRRRGRTRSQDGRARRRRAGQRGQGLHRALRARSCCRTACRCTAASASPSSTTCTSFLRRHHGRPRAVRHPGRAPAARRRHRRHETEAAA